MKTFSCKHHFFLKPDRSNCSSETLAKLRLRCGRNSFRFVCEIPARTHRREFRTVNKKENVVKVRSLFSLVASACFGSGPPDMEKGD
jgi:hypothetical protein